MPQWVIPATIIFWAGALVAVALRYVWSQLNGTFVLLVISLFLSLAIEPGVNRLAKHGWRRGNATAVLLFGVVLLFLLFLVAIGTLVGSQIADLLQNTESYIRDTVNFLNDTFGFHIDPQEAIDAFNDPNGPVQRFISNQQGNAVRPLGHGARRAAQAVLGDAVHVLPDRRWPAAAPGDLQPAAARASGTDAQHLGAGGEQDRRLPLLEGAAGAAVGDRSTGSSSSRSAPRRRSPSRLWVGIVSQFLPVVGTYLAGILPVVVTFLDSPLKALIVLIAIVVYQQIENYLFSPRITARTMELHPALAFGAALGGAALLGAVGAILALPAAAMAQALLSELGSAPRRDRQRPHPAAHAAGALAGAPSRPAEALATAAPEPRPRRRRPTDRRVRRATGRHGSLTVQPMIEAHVERMHQ